MKLIIFTVFKEPETGSVFRILPSNSDPICIRNTARANDIFAILIVRLQMFFYEFSMLTLVFKMQVRL